jgi:hypothetical protein
LKRNWRIAQSEWHGNTLHYTIMCLKRSFVDVLVTYSNLPEAIREVDMGVKFRVLQPIEGFVHMRKWVGVLTRNFVKATVVNAQSKRAIGLTHKKFGEPNLF